MHIRALDLSDLPALKEFTDQSIGANYYSMDELAEVYQKSKKGDQVFTLLLLDDNNKIQGVRITYPPGNWQGGKGKGLHPDLWDVPQADVGYFQSLFISEELTGQGWGRKLSLHAIELLKKIGTKAIVTHSWKESPNDSSGRYLRGLGFQVIATHAEYWKDVDYQCTRDGNPCLCTAEEMLLRI